MLTDDDRKEAKKATDIEPLQIQVDYIRVPGDLAYWGQKYAGALRAAMVAEHERRTTEARVLLGLRGSAKVAGEKPTVDEVNAHVATHPEVLAALLAEIDAQVAKEQVRAILEAIRGKKEMLVSLGAHLREEMRDDPTVRVERRLDSRERAVARR